MNSANGDQHTLSNGHHSPYSPRMMEDVVIVGGGGHVGLPLGLVLAEAGKYVTLLDIDASKVAMINAGTMPFREAGAEETLQRVIGRCLRATTDTSCLRKASVVITVIGTPVDKHLNPTVRELYKSIDELLPLMKDGALLVLRSTVYPGVTQLIYERIRGLRRSIHLAFCPERIAEGKAMEELVLLPQIVSGCEPEAQRLARGFFLSIAPSVIELSPLEAELAKLFTNSWRYLNFAISNQFYTIAQRCGLDFHRIRDAVMRDYPRMQSFARAGFAAGPCLLKDTLQLSAFANNSFFMGHAAMLVNEGLPNVILSQLLEMDLSQRTVGIVGMAFKAESDDRRESLSYKLRNILSVYAGEVLCTDPYVQDDDLLPLEEVMRRSHVIVLGAPHAPYSTLRFRPDQVVVDVWGFWRGAGAGSTEARPSAMSAKAGTIA